MEGSQITSLPENATPNVTSARSIIDILPTEILVRALQTLDPAKKEDQSALATSLRVFKAVSREIRKHLYRRCHVTALQVRPPSGWRLFLHPNIQYCRHLVVDSVLHKPSLRNRLLHSDACLEEGCGIHSIGPIAYKVELMEIDLDWIQLCDQGFHGIEEHYCRKCEEEDQVDEGFSLGRASMYPYSDDNCDHCHSDLGHCLTPYLVKQLNPSILVADVDVSDDKNEPFNVPVNALAAALRYQKGSSRTNTFVLRLGWRGLYGQLPLPTRTFLQAAISNLVIIFDSTAVPKVEPELDAEDDPDVKSNVDPDVDRPCIHPSRFQEAIDNILSLLNDVQPSDHPPTSRKITLVGLCDAYEVGLAREGSSGDPNSLANSSNSAQYPTDEDLILPLSLKGRQRLNGHLLSLIRKQAMDDTSWMTVRTQSPKECKTIAQDILDRVELIGLREYAETLKGTRQGVLTEAMWELAERMTEQESKMERLRGENAGSADVAPEIIVEEREDQPEPT